MIVINAIDKNEKVVTHIHLLFDSVNDIRSSFVDFKCSFIHRDGNTVAQMIARWDTDNALEKIRTELFLLDHQALVDLALS